MHGSICCPHFQKMSKTQHVHTLERWVKLMFTLFVPQFRFYSSFLQWHLQKHLFTDFLICDIVLKIDADFGSFSNPVLDDFY